MYDIIEGAEFCGDNENSSCKGINKYIFSVDFVKKVSENIEWIFHDDIVLIE